MYLINNNNIIKLSVCREGLQGNSSCTVLMQAKGYKDLGDGNQGMFRERIQETFLGL